MVKGEFSTVCASLCSVVSSTVELRTEGEYMHTDVLGRKIHPGDVCGFASRRGTHTNLEIVVVREVLHNGVRGHKIVKEYNRGWQVKLVPTRMIVRPDHLVITGLSEKEAVELVRSSK